MIVNGPGDELFAGTALAVNQHGGLAADDLVEQAVDRLHGRGIADNIGKALARVASLGLARVAARILGVALGDLACTVVQKIAEVAQIGLG